MKLTAPTWMREKINPSKKTNRRKKNKKIIAYEALNGTEMEMATSDLDSREKLKLEWVK